MEVSTSQQLFLLLLKASTLSVKSGYEDSYVSLEWDLNNKQLIGGFVLPLSFNVNLQEGKFQIDVVDFLQEELSSNT